MKRLRQIAPFLILLALSNAMAGSNLVPNPDFSDAKDPMATWRTYFPWESEWYAENGKYVKAAKEDDKTCALMDVPKAIASNQGGKIESAFFRIEPGAKYLAVFDVKIGSGGVKAFAEAWTTDPDPGLQNDKWRVPAAADHPAVLTCYRAQFPNPKETPGEWIPLSREFTVPRIVYIKGKQQTPEYLTIKVVLTGADDAKAWVTNFRVTKIP
jgi:hypothetical protein